MDPILLVGLVLAALLMRKTTTPQTAAVTKVVYQSQPQVEVVRPAPAPLALPAPIADLTPVDMGTIDESISTDEPTTLYKWTPTVLALKAKPGPAPIHIYTRGDVKVFVLDNTLSQTDGEILDDYGQFDVAAQYVHFRTVIDPDQVEAVVDGSQRTCPMPLIASESLEAIYACLHLLLAQNPRYQITES